MKSAKNREAMDLIYGVKDPRGSFVANRDGQTISVLGKWIGFPEGVMEE